MKRNTTGGTSSKAGDTTITPEVIKAMTTLEFIEFKKSLTIEELWELNMENAEISDAISKRTDDEIIHRMVQEGTLKTDNVYECRKYYSWEELIDQPEFNERFERHGYHIGSRIDDVC